MFNKQMALLAKQYLSGLLSDEEFFEKLFDIQVAERYPVKHKRFDSITAKR